MHTDLFTLIGFTERTVDFFFFVVWIVVAGGVAVSAILFATGRQRQGGKMFMLTLLSAFIVAFGYTLLTTLFPQTGYSFPGSADIAYLAYGAVAVSMGACALYLVAGHVEKAAGYFTIGALVLLVFNFGPAWFSVSSATQNSGPDYLQISANPTIGSPPLDVNLTGQVFPANTSGGASINWGDGASTFTKITSGSFTALHLYNATGNYQVIVTASNGTPSAEASVNIVVVNQSTSNTTNWLVGAVMDFVKSVAGPAYSFISGVFNVPFDLFVDIPYFGAAGGSFGEAMDKMYSYTEGVSLGFLGAFFIADLGWTIWSEGADDLADTVVRLAKDGIMVSLVMLTAPYFYNAFAGVINTVGNGLIAYGNPGGLLLLDIPLILAGATVGYFVPFLATLSADLVFALAVATALAVLRYLLVGAIIVTAPILSVLWLFPPLRRIVGFFFELCAGLAIAGVISAIALALFSKLALAAPSVISVVMFLASPIFFTFLPSFVSFGVVGGGGVGGLASGISRKWAGRKPYHADYGDKITSSSTDQPTSGALTGLNSPSYADYYRERYRAGWIEEAKYYFGYPDSPSATNIGNKAAAQKRKGRRSDVLRENYTQFGSHFIRRTKELAHSHLNHDLFASPRRKRISSTEDDNERTHPGI